jgi:hypothetical protein
MIRVKVGLFVIGMGAVLVACGGGSDPAGGGPATSGTGSGGTSSTGGTRAAGGNATSGSGGTGVSDPRSYGSVFESLSEVCDILVFGQIAKQESCWGARDSEAARVPEAPSPRYNCPDVLFSDGSTRVRTLEGAWACVDQWAALTCQDLFEGTIPACVSPGTLPAGAACIAGSQCQSGECGGGAFSGECGVCLEIGDGVTCDEQTACTGLNFCEAGMCVPAVPDPNQPYVPPTPVGPNEACEGGICGEGYVCVANDTLDARICRPELAVDQPCYQSQPFVPEVRICTLREEEIYCDPITQMCRALGAVGEACGASAIGSRCGEGAGCNDLGICALPGGPGTPCLEGGAFSQACGDGEICDEGTCKTIRYYGEPCTQALTEKCDGRGLCVAGVCTPDDTLTSMSELCAAP